MKLIMLAGIKAKPIASTNTMNTLLMLAARSLSFYETGKGELIMVNFKSGLPVACCKID